jgi:hypothetical protein
MGGIYNNSNHVRNAPPFRIKKAETTGGSSFGSSAIFQLIDPPLSALFSRRV